MTHTVTIKFNIKRGKTQHVRIGIRECITMGLNQTKMTTFISNCGNI